MAQRKGLENFDRNICFQGIHYRISAGADWTTLYVYVDRIADDQDPKVVWRLVVDREDRAECYWQLCDGSSDSRDHQFTHPIPYWVGDTEVDGIAMGMALVAGEMIR